MNELTLSMAAIRSASAGAYHFDFPVSVGNGYQGSFRSGRKDLTALDQLRCTSSRNRLHIGIAHGVSPSLRKSVVWFLSHQERVVSDEVSSQQFGSCRRSERDQNEINDNEFHVLLLSGKHTAPLGKVFPIGLVLPDGL
jgi:hypothetical protein